MYDAPPNPETEPLDDAVAARAERRRRAVDAMIEMGVRLTERLCAEVEAAEDAGEASVAARLGGRDPALAYSRLFRAVRLGAALGERLDDPDREPAAKERPGRAGAAEDDAPADDRPDPLELARRRTVMRGTVLTGTISRVVESMIEIEVEDDEHGVGGVRATRMFEALYEGFEDEDELEAIGDRSIGESIALICQDLGLKPDWKDWRLEEWAKQEAREETPGSPFGTPRRVPWVEPEAVEPAEGEANVHGPP